MLLAKFWPIYGVRDDLRTVVSTLARGKNPSTRIRVRVWMQTWFANLGTSLAHVNPGYHGEMNIEDLKVVPASWKCDPVNRVYVDRFLTLAEREKIPVFWLLPPVLPEVVATMERNGVSRDYEQFIRSIIDRFPGD